MQDLLQNCSGCRSPERQLAIFWMDIIKKIFEELPGKILFEMKQKMISEQEEDTIITSS